MHNEWEGHEINRIWREVVAKAGLWTVLFRSKLPLFNISHLLTSLVMLEVCQVLLRCEQAVSEGVATRVVEFRG